MRSKKGCALLLAAALILSLSIPALAAEPQPTAAQAADLAAQYGQATAVSYAVWDNGKLTVSGSAGVYSKTENRALTDDCLYGIGSVSKIYTTAAVMKLADAGKLSLDAPVTRYLPAFQMADPRYRQITVRMLLNHSSGLMGGSTNDVFLFGDPDRRGTTELLTRLSTQRLKAEPGTIAVYCNDGFTLAELVVEAVSGQTFGAFLHEQLLAPAKCADTFVPQDSFDTARLVKTYQSAQETRPLAQDTLGIVGTGGIYASASDLAAFGGALTNGSLLSDASAKAMANAEYKRGIWPADDTDSVAYGLGWDSVKYEPFSASGIQALAKGGDTLYYHAGLVVLPEYKLAAAVVTSGGVSVYNEMAAAKMLVAALADKGIAVDEAVPTLPTATPAQMPEALLANAGYYGNYAQQIKISLSRDGALTLHFANAPTLPDQIYRYYSDGSFRDESGQALALKLVPEKNGLTYLYQKNVTPIPGLGYMPTSQYVAQKLTPHEIPAETQAAWDSLAGKPFLPVNLKYTSQLYPALFTQAATAAPESVPGYFTGLKIQDEKTAANVFQIPNIGGRDSQDARRYTENGVQFYTTTQGAIYRDYSDMPNLYADGRAICTIARDGYARWYAVAAKDAGKQMTVSHSGEGGFFVFDKEGCMTASSAAYGDTAATLPADGLLVFAGNPATRFTLSFSK